MLASVNVAAKRSTRFGKSAFLVRLASGMGGKEPLVTASKVGESKIIIEMNRPPVNSISKEMADSIAESVGAAEADEEVQSIILKSSNRKVFSAGLDIEEMNNPEPERLEAFWRSIQGLFLTLYGTRCATVAAIEGHAPAGGYLLAMCCDYRIMAVEDDFNRPKIGLNETKLGELDLLMGIRSVLRATSCLTPPRPPAFSCVLAKALLHPTG